jgi:hypothetical protein
MGAGDPYPGIWDQPTTGGGVGGQGAEGFTLLVCFGVNSPTTEYISISLRDKQGTNKQTNSRGRHHDGRQRGGWALAGGH